MGPSRPGCGPVFTGRTSGPSRPEVFHEFGTEERHSVAFGSGPGPGVARAVAVPASRAGGTIRVVRSRAPFQARSFVRDAFPTEPSSQPSRACRPRWLSNRAEVALRPTPFNRASAATAGSPSPTAVIDHRRRVAVHIRFWSNRRIRSSPRRDSPHPDPVVEEETPQGPRKACSDTEGMGRLPVLTDPAPGTRPHCRGRGFEGKHQVRIFRKQHDV